MVKRFAVYVLLLVPISLLASWVMQAPDVEAFTGGSIAIPVFGTTQDSIRGFEFQMAFCDDEDSLKITLDSVTLKGYGAPYTTIFDTLPTADSWTLDVNLDHRSMYWGIAFIGHPDTSSVPAFDSAIIYVMWVHVESSVNAPDTVELDLNEQPTCPPGNSYECGFLDPQYNLHRAQLVDGTLSLLPYTLELSFEPGQPQNFPEGEVNQINVLGTSSDSNDVLLLELIGGLEPWMSWSGSDTGHVTEGTVELNPGHCDDGLYELRFRLSSYIYDTSVTQVDTVIIYDMDRPPFFVNVTPGDGIYGAGSLIQENVIFGDSDMACPTGHVVDFLTLSYYLIPEPVASEPNLIDNGDGSGTFEWTPAEEDEGNYILGLVATDMYGVSDTVEVSLIVRAQPGYLDYSYRLQLKQMCAFSGEEVYYPVYFTNPEPVGGYEILIAYDSTCLSLQDIVENEIGGYTSEYFNYNPMPAGVVDSFPAVRILAIRDMANATYTPPIPADSNQILFYLVFFVNSNLPPNRDCEVKFIVQDTGDNSFSDTTGLVLHVPVVMDVAVQDENTGNCSFEEYFVGLGDSTLIAWDIALLDGFDWVEGAENCDPGNYCPMGLITANPAFIGDVNLNGDAFEVSDIIFFNSYLLGFFPVDDDTLTPPVGWTLRDWHQSRANSDVNMNGVYYEMGDLVLLRAITNGFINPPEDMVSDQIDGILRYSQNDRKIYIENDREVSAIYLKIRYTGEIGSPVFGEITHGMLQGWNDLGDELRVLVCGLGNKYLPPGEWELVEIPGTGELTISEISAGTPWGSILKTVSASGERFSLKNLAVWPNPFKEKAIISFELGSKAQVDIKAYNATGRLVREVFSGELEAGDHEIVWDGKTRKGEEMGNGIYFIEVKTGSFRGIKKVLYMR